MESSKISLLLILLMISSLGNLPQASSEVQTPTGLLVPLYSYPGTVWESLLHEHLLFPHIPMVVVINPYNGPSTYNQAYYNYTRQFSAAGIIILGYVYTQYANRSIQSVESDIAAYKSYYPQLQGIFIDEMSNSPLNDSYYLQLTTYSHGLGLGLVIGNPGNPAPESLLTSVDNLVVSENSYIPSVQYLTSSTYGLPKSDFTVIAHNITSSLLNQTEVTALSEYAGFIYMTDTSYGSLPSYLNTLMAYIEQTLPASAMSGTSQAIALPPV